VNWLPDADTISDRRSERGSLVGIHTALSHARASVLVVAWDMPFVSSALLQLIADRATSAACAAIPDGPDGLEPFCAAYTPACLPHIERAIESGDLRLRRIIAELPAIEVISRREIRAIGDPARLFFNVNSAEQLAEAERLAAAQ